ncbi:MAG TPA: TonB-dependent receptor [Steroidobacteraceae bacterium]|nr:TonB-dependent receptor [Steroidobacteraceae bacterium]
MTTSRTFAAWLLCACIALPAASHADDLSSLKGELEALKSDYQARIAKLEARIGQLETQVAASPPAAAGGAAPPADVLAAAAADAAAAGVASAEVSMPAQAAGRNPAAAFNPAMSVILGGNYANTSQDPDTYRIAGFIPSGGDVGPGARSFNLGESELTLAANIDPYFFGNLTASINGDNEISVEEAYFKTIAVPHGFVIKGGRFFSGFGYLNEQHAHAWDFVDQPLVYQAFFGGQLAQNGVQAKWVAPTVLFLEFGAETGNGQEFPGTHRDRNGLNGATLFSHLGGDIGDSTSWRAGVSWVDLHADARTYDDVDQFGLPVVNSFTGKSRTWVGDVTFKWSPHGNPIQHNLKFQAEYMRRTEDGALAFDTDNLALNGDYDTTQSGWYVQSVYQFMPRWRIGARYDALDSGDTHIGLVDAGLLPLDDFPLLQSADPTRVTLMLDWSPSEFSRLRAQYAWDDARNTDTDRQFQLQYIYSIGAHGAHKF